MKLNTLLLIFAVILPVGLANADTVIEEVPDILPGKSFGGLSGCMLGATAGPLPRCGGPYYLRARGRSRVTRSTNVLTLVDISRGRE